MAHKQILFLCTGNYYRSRMAEEMFNHFAAERGLQARAFSRDLATSFERNGNAGGFSEFTLRVLTHYGITPRRSDEFPQHVTTDELRNSALVIGVYQRDPAPMLAEQVPGFARKVIYWSVPDLDEISEVEAGEFIFREVENLIQKFKNKTHHTNKRAYLIAIGSFSASKNQPFPKNHKTSHKTDRAVSC